MCVIVHQPESAHIDKETARKLWQENPDGGGFAFVDDDGDLHVTKAMSFKEFWSLFEQARSKHGKRDYLLHMRIATHGKVNLDNVHPFRVDDYTVVAHNGIIHSVSDGLASNSEKSDTRVFVEEVLPELPENWLDSKYLPGMVDEFIGWSKLMFVTNNPNLEKTVYRLGDWDEYNGLYLSNLYGLLMTKGNKKGAKKAATTNYLETSDDWYDWWNYQNRWTKDDDKSDLSTWEFDLLLDGLKAERAGMFITWPLVIINDTTPEINCGGCGGDVNIETAECSCWDLVCGECWHFVAQCRETSLCKDTDQYDYELLTPEGKRKVANAQTQPTIRLVRSTDGSEGEGNTLPKSL